VPLVATYRVVVAADALFVTPKKENANIAVQMNPTRVLFSIDVLLIIHFSISKFVSAFCVLCAKRVYGAGMLNRFVETNKPLLVASRQLLQNTNPIQK